ncbi:LuxR C-terminal-related transcriptional regulator [Aurantimonas sp. VKM B-3413]|uniref:helix-turn-helix transcriptional regulator n=1 Tax=Aurantimonas sp. VKM B-3413 TaxID=2779401 RepID=UPI001E65CE92|nr:LuxR C-terminal-related transcriptional regulator [Aurantimonas sp. VKM B-3413]MCB8839627.1 LuxR C-terminal-related transcriptional regulator [Aurantimonas sp. VKM B-3413]
MTAPQSRLANALKRLYGSLDTSRDWQQALGACAAAVGAERFNLLTLGHDGVFRQETFPFDPDGVLDYAANYAHKDLRVSRAITRPSGFLTTPDLMTADEIAACPVHQEFYRRYPECWVTSMVVHRCAEGLVVPVAHRGARHGELSERERRVLIALAGHVVRVAHMRQRLPEGMIARDGVLAAFDSLDEALALFDHDGLVVHANARLEALIARGDALSLQGRTLQAVDPRTTSRLIRAMAQTIRFLSGDGFVMPEPLAIPRPGRRSPLLIRFFAAPNPSGRSGIGVLKIVDPDEARGPSPTAIRAALGLTPAESALALAIYRGLTIKEFADTSGLSEQTIRTRVKQVSEKLGVRRQVEIATRIAALARL